MKTFKTLINELSLVPVVSLDKNTADCAKPETRNEINKNLRAVTAQGFANPYMALERVRKVLSGYGIELPQVQFHDEPMAVKVFPISQFGAKSGEAISTTGIIVPPTGESGADYFVYFVFSPSSNGVYDAFAAVVDQEALELLSKIGQ